MFLCLSFIFSYTFDFGKLQMITETYFLSIPSYAFPTVKSLGKWIAFFSENNYCWCAIIDQTYSNAWAEQWPNFQLTVTYFDKKYGKRKRKLDVRLKKYMKEGTSFRKSKT